MGRRGAETKFVVRLSGDERADLERMTRTGRNAAYRLLRALWRELFESDPPPFNRRYLESRLAYRI